MRHGRERPTGHEPSDPAGSVVRLAAASLAVLAAASVSACGHHGGHIELWVWGTSSYEAHLGYATAAASPVAELRGVGAVGAGPRDAYAVASDGTVWGFGANDRGQLGNGQTSTTAVSEPVQIAGVTPMRAVDGGEQYAIALGGDGTVWAWGQGSDGQLGDGAVLAGGDLALRPLPVRGAGGVGHLGGAVAVSAGEALSMALDGAGHVWTWGDATDGALATGSAGAGGGAVAVPVQAALSHIVAIAAGSRFGAALDSDGSVWTWGQNASGELGTAAAAGTTRSIPQRVPGLGRMVALAVGYAATGHINHVVVAGADGTVWGWGANDAGQVGDGTTDNRSSPVQVTSLRHVVQVAAGPMFTLAARDDGSVWAWGSDSHDTLGDGPLGSSLAPVQVQQTYDGSVFGPLQHVTAIAADGTVCLAH